MMGRMDVIVSYGDQYKRLPLLVVSGKGPSLLGKDWLIEIRLKWNRVHDESLEQVLQEHSEVSLVPERIPSTQLPLPFRQ